jgi:NADPH:quinone reductase-like Zn-dependent oxidoreductase
LAFHAGQTPLLARHPGVAAAEHKILGVDIAGQVETVGRRATRFKPGDEVYANVLYRGYGGFAEYVRCQLTLWP